MPARSSASRSAASSPGSGRSRRCRSIRITVTASSTNPTRPASCGRRPFDRCRPAPASRSRTTHPRRPRRLRLPQRARRRARNLNFRGGTVMLLRRTAFVLLACSAAVVLSTQLGAGCTNTDTNSDSRTEQAAIPHNARVVDNGVGPLSYTARNDGHVWLYDQDDRTVLDSRRIKRGQQYRVMPDDNRVTLDDKKVYDQDLKRKHAHRIYFQSSDTSSSSSDRDTLDRSDSGSDVPRSAPRVAAGSGELTYRAKNNGHVYIVDEDNNRLVYDRAIHDGQEIVVQPDDDRIRIDGHNAFTGNLEHKHSHRIYFDRD